VRLFWSLFSFRVAVLFGILGLAAAPAGAQPDSLRRQFESANEAYAQGRYEHALETYRALLDAGYASAALYHNLGNTYVRLGRTGPAVWAYERGRTLRPDAPRLRHNLSYVRRRAGLPQVGLPPRGLAALVAGWSPLLLFVGGLLLLSAGLGGAAYDADQDRIVAWRTPLTWGPAAAGLLLAVVALGTSYVQAHDRRGVVMSETVSLRASPANTAPPDSTLPGGTMVELQASQGQWWRVRLGDGTTGWLPTDALDEV
jgi:tetratricopeptide (TPR) repeat protein